MKAIPQNFSSLARSHSEVSMNVVDVLTMSTHVEPTYHDLIILLPVGDHFVHGHCR